MSGYARRTMDKDWKRHIPADIMAKARKVTALGRGVLVSELDDECCDFEIHDVAQFLWADARPEEAKNRKRVTEAQRRFDSKPVRQ